MRRLVPALALGAFASVAAQQRLPALHAQDVAPLQITVDRADATYAIGDSITVCAVWTIIPPAPNGEVFVAPARLRLTLVGPGGATQLLLDAPAMPSILGGISNTGLRPQCATASVTGPAGCWTASAQLTLDSGAPDQAAGVATALFLVYPAQTVSQSAAGPAADSGPAPGS